MRELDLTALAASDVVAKAVVVEDCVAEADLAIWELLLDFSYDALSAAEVLVILVLEVPSRVYKNNRIFVWSL